VRPYEAGDDERGALRELRGQVADERFEPDRIRLSAWTQAGRNGKPDFVLDLGERLVDRTGAR